MYTHYLLLMYTHYLLLMYQNVGYTSSIVLKRVMKAKVELGLVLMFLFFTPVLYNLSMTIILVLDWNDSTALSIRKGVNFEVGCYILAFPPFKDRKSRDTDFECPFASTIDTSEPVRSQVSE